MVLISANLCNGFENFEVFPVHLALFIISEVLKALNLPITAKTNTVRINIITVIFSADILISRSGEAQLTDSVFQEHFKWKNETRSGKYAYMAPEQVEAKC